MQNPIQQKNPPQLQQIKDNNNKMQPPRRPRSSTATKAKVVPSMMAASLVAANGIELQTVQWVLVEKEKGKAIHRLASRATRAMASDGTTTRRAKERASPRASTALKEKEKARKDMANGMDGRHLHVAAWTLRRASLTLRRELRDPRSSTSPHRAEAEIIAFGRNTASSSESEVMKQEDKSHVAAFSFAFNYHYQEMAEYFAVRGEKRRGLIIDPGAASGLIGSETLRDLIQHCVKSRGKDDELAINRSKTSPVFRNQWSQRPDTRRDHSPLDVWWSPDQLYW